MDSSHLVGWQQEKAELQREVSHLQEVLAESRAERDELESKSRALNDRLRQSVSPSLALSLRVEAEQRAWRKKVREGREREARQTLLIHRLRNKVLEYRDRCQQLERQLQDDHKQLLDNEWRIRDEHSDSLESALIRLEEEQQRSISLTETNTLLREQLSQSEENNQALRVDLKKLTADWTRAVEEAEHKESYWQRENERQSDHEGQHQVRLLSVWRSLVTLRQLCRTLKTAADRDLWQLRAEFSQMSSSILSSCDSVFFSLKLNGPHLKSPSLSQHASTLIPFDLHQTSLAPPLCSTLLHQPPLPSALPLSSILPSPPPDPPLDSTSALGTFSLTELEYKEEDEQSMSELNLLHEAEVSQLKEQITELSHLLQAEQRQREGKEQEMKKHLETERSLQSVSHGVIRLFRVLSSCSSRPLSVSSDSILSLDLCSLLSVLSHTESALQWRNEELQGVELSVWRLSEEKAAMQHRLKQLENENLQLQMLSQQSQVELTHTLDLLNREREATSSLRLQVDEFQMREEAVKRENETLRQERDRQEERNQQLESETHKRVENELLENIQLTEKERLHRLEIHTLKGALEREQLDKHRAEEEAAGARDALQKSRECVLHLSSSECVLKREVQEGRDALEKMAALNSALASDKKELHKQLLEVECVLSDNQSQLEALRSEFCSLQREVRAFNTDCTELRAQRELDAEAIRQLRQRESELETITEGKETELITLKEAMEMDERQLEKLSFQHTLVCTELKEVQEQLRRAHEEVRRRDRWHEEQQRNSRRLQEEHSSLERHKDSLEAELQELRSVTVSLHQQLGQHQKQLSLSQVDKCQLQTHIHTLHQAKETFHGEIACLRAELEQAVAKGKDEEDKKEQNKKDNEELQQQIQMLMEETQTLRTRRKEEEQARNEERKSWQSEREALSEELGMRLGEVAMLRRTTEGLTGEKQDIQKEVERLRKDLTAKEVEMSHLMEKIQWLEGEKGRLDKDMVDIEVRTREEEMQRDRELEALCDRLDRLEREKEGMQEELEQVRCETEREVEVWRTKVEEMEVEINRLSEEIPRLEHTTEIEMRKERLQVEEERRRREEEMTQLRDTAKKAEADMEKLRSMMEEVESEKCKNERLQDEKEEALRGLLEKTGEVELLRLGLSVATEEREEVKEAVDKLEHRLEHQMSAVREREEEVEHLRKLMEERGEKALMEQQEVNQKLVEMKAREEQLETMLRERQILLEKERRRGDEKDDRLFSQAKELQEAHEATVRAKTRVRENEEAQRKMEEELDEWREKAEQSANEMAKLSQVFKEREKEVQQLKVTLEERDEEENEGQRRTEERRRKLDSKLQELDKEKARLEDKLKEVEEETEEEREVLRKVREEVKRMEDRTGEMQNEIKELRRAKEETASLEMKKLEDKLREREKEKHELREVVMCKEDEIEKLEGKVREAKEEQERLFQAEKDQHLLVVERGRFILREAEELKAGLSEKLSRREKEAAALREEVQRERDKTQKELRRHEQEVLRLKEEIIGEQDEKRGIQEELWRTEREVAVLRKEPKNKAEEIIALKEQRREENQCDAQQHIEELQVELRRNTRELSLLEGEIHRDRMELEEALVGREKRRKGTQQLGSQRDEELRRTKEELTNITEKLQEEQSQKVQIQEKLTSTDKEITVLREELQKEQRRREQVQEELRGVQQSMGVMTVNLSSLQGQLSEVSQSRQRAHEEMTEEENRQLREGLRTALEEMTKLKLFLQESHTEGERLKNALNKKKQEIIIKEDNLRAAREDMQKERGAFEEMRAKVKTLDRRRKEVMEELDLAKQATWKVEEERREIEKQWRSRLEEQEIKLKELMREIQAVKEKEQAVSREFRLQVEERDKKVEETQTELDQVRATLAMLEEQKSLATRDNRSEVEEGSPSHETHFQLMFELHECYKEDICIVLQEREEIRRQLIHREAEVYALTQRTKELEDDRARIRLALDRTEAAMIDYRERAHQQEQSPGTEPDLDESVGDRLVVLQHLVAELELEQKVINTKNSHLENQKEKLKRDRNTLRDTLRRVEEERSRFRQQLIDSGRPQAFVDTTEEGRLRTRVKELEEQVSQLCLSLAVEQQQREEFIQQSSRNSQWLLSLRQDLTESLAVVTHCPIPSILESETQRLDDSLRVDRTYLSQV